MVQGNEGPRVGWLERNREVNDLNSSQNKRVDVRCWFLALLPPPGLRDLILL